MIESRAASILMDSGLASANVVFGRGGVFNAFAKSSVEVRFGFRRSLSTRDVLRSWLASYIPPSHLSQL